MTVRVRHWTRWRRGQLSRGWRHRVHVDPLVDEARALWLCSWQRSGSTLLAGVLASGRGTRLVYEPANVPGALLTGEAAAQVPLPTGPGPELEAVERALRGRVHGAWVDQLATGRVFARRVVKDVRAVGLLPIVAVRHPATPIVLLVRHPLAVARSVVELGWTPGGAEGDEALLGEVRRWASLHAAALGGPWAHRVLVVPYEHLVLDADGTLDAVLRTAASHHPTWRGVDVDRALLAEPSATSFRRTGTRAGREWIGSFDDVAPRVLDETARILGDAGLGALYGTSPEPLVGLGEVAASVRR
ncbi:MAG TPA: sulfotransferase [Acidimicrobiales bacterium]|nr:sulfotransferase [Acidimicrobiales bacterium]